MILTDKLLSSVFSLKKALAAAIASTINVAVIKLKRKKNSSCLAKMSNSPSTIKT